MPSVTSQSSWAAATACRTAASKAPVSAMTWSAANEPTTASGSRRSTTAAASPIAAIESRGDGSASTASAPRPGSCSRTAAAVGLAGHDEDPGAGQRRQPVDGRLEQRAAAAGEVVEELGAADPRERPQPGAGAARPGSRPRSDRGSACVEA